jgi:integrase
MRVRLKGINRVRTRLADGRVVTYYYAWKGGPRLEGEPGSPEFVASYRENLTVKAGRRDDVLAAIFRSYQQSDDFRQLAPRTRADYAGKIGLIERKFGDFPLRALSDPRTRGILLAWRDELALKSRRQADYAWVVLARGLSWALNRGLTTVNPAARGGRLYRGSRNDKVWSVADEKAFLQKAPSHLHLPLLLALWTGQRQGDLLNLRWDAYDGRWIKLTQSKTGMKVAIPVGRPLLKALNAAAKSKTGASILVNSMGVRWTEDGFRSSWRKACAAAGVTGVTFNDLRGTAVTRLALVGATEAEMATITGHSLRDVRSILDSNYLHRDPALAESAIRKLEKRKPSA